MTGISGELIVLPWNSNLETGIAEIDAQHKALVNLLNKLASTLIDDNRFEIDSVFDELAAYAEYHFQTEEEVWTRYFGEDDWAIVHHKSHVAFMPKVIEIQQNNTHESMHVVIEKVVKFLIRWLILHIIDRDRRMAIVVEGINSGMSLAEAKAAANERMNNSFDILIETLLSMHDALSFRTLELMRERLQREAVENELRQANQRLETLAITDVLTGLYNRLHFNEVFEQELRRARRSGLPLAILMVDLDCFKQLNDHYGHAQGDHALAAIGATIKQLCRRPGDFGFRLGGEEFCIIVSDVENAEQIHSFAEIFRTAVSSLKIPNALSGVASVLTVSVGAVLVTAVAAEEDGKAIMKLVDDNLYEAKRSGRNRVVFSRM